MDDCIGDEFSSLAQLDPFDSAMSTVGTYGSWRDHYLSASDAPDGHELPLAAVLVEFLDRGISQLAQSLAPLQDVNHSGRT